jgi:uncharacterized OB-fold protein
MATQVPLAEGLFTWPSDEPSLIAGRCPETGKLSFPRKERLILNDGSFAETDVELRPRRGRLWTFTTQRFRPPSPYAGNDTAETFQPYAVGYVELPGALKVQGRLTEPDPTKLRIGQEMELVIEPFGVDDQGRETVLYAFAPVQDGDAA